MVGAGKGERREQKWGEEGIRFARDADEKAARVRYSPPLVDRGRLGAGARAPRAAK